LNFELSDDQRMIRDSAETFLADACDPAAVRRAMETKDGFDPATWQRIASELGWCGIPVPEAHGGLGLGPVELVLIQEQAGRRLLCAPFFSSVCMAATSLEVLATSAAQEAYLPGIAQGRLRATLPLPSDAWAGAGVTATEAGTSWVLDGAVGQIPDGATAEMLFIPAHLETGELGLFAVEASTVSITPRATWDATRRFADAKLDGVPADRIDDPARRAEGVIRAIALGRLYIAAEQLGGAQQCLDATVAYLATRKQFGRALSSFQALKHRCAEMMVAVEATRSMVYGAAAVAAMGELSAMVFECAAAKALASETYFYCAQEAIQLHGGVGFTWEYDAHLHFKRAQASSHWLGSPDALHELIAAAHFAEPA
jgi:alkylation response protein AidB-like acyl-CoA dehydrogenase